MTRLRSMLRALLAPGSDTWRVIAALALVFAALALGIWVFSIAEEWGAHRSGGDDRIVVEPHR